MEFFHYQIKLKGFLMNKRVNKSFKLSTVALSIMVMTTGSMAQNIGFEDGTTSGWTGDGFSAVPTQTFTVGGGFYGGPNTWTVNPYGTYMGRLTPNNVVGTFSQMANSLSLSSASVTELQNLLVTQAQVTGNGSGQPTNAAWASKVVTLTAGQTFTLAWQYISSDYVPFNDGSIATLVKVNDPNAVGVLNNYSKQYALLGFTNPGTGDYSTGSYGSTGWQTVTFTAPSDGDYILGLGVFNLDDTLLDPVFYVDEITGTVTLNNAVFNPIAPNPGTLAPNNSGPTLVSDVTNTTAGTDVLDSGTITVNNGTIKIMLDGVTLTQLFDVQSGTMTIDQNSNNATFGGVISGPGGVVITNTGTGGSITFTEVNTYTGSTTIDQGATLINNGSIASSSGVTNNGTFINNGQASDVTNNNYFVNSATGTISSLVNNGVALNAGTVTGTVTNSGEFNNSGTTGDWTNYGAVTNTGTRGNGTNYSVFSNNGTVGTVNNQGLFVNNGTTGDVTNSGAFVFMSGTVTNITNSGTVDLSLMNGTTSLTGNYTQTNTGTTIIDGSQKFTINGVATLAGNLTILNSPTTIGKYTYLTAGSVVGQFDSLISNTGVLRYTNDTVQLWVMPDGTVVQSQVNGLASNLSLMNSLASGVISGAVGTDCALFGPSGYCVSVNYGSSKAATGELASTGVSFAKKLNQNWRVAVFGNQQLNKPTIGDITFESKHPTVGLTLGYNSSVDGTGLGSTVSFVSGSGSYKIGSDKTGVNGNAGQVKLTYGMSLSDKTMVTPYVGLRHNTFNIKGYTEQGPIFPLSFNSVSQSTTDLLVGASLSHNITDKLSGSVSTGLVQNLSYQSGTVNATSDMGDFSSKLSGKHYTSMSIGAGLSYKVDKTQSIGVNLGWQQRTLTNANFASMGVTYTLGF